VYKVYREPKERDKMFKFLKPNRLLHLDNLNEKTSFLIDSFIPEQNITMWYCKENQGKTALSLGVAKYILDHCDIKMMVYMDMDNPRKNLSDRNLKDTIGKYDNFHFIHRSTIDITPYELLKDIGAEAYGSNYKGCVFIFDSIRNFVDGDINNDTKVRAIMDIMMNIREAGGTIIINHHTTKNGKGIDGSGEFAKSLDNLYYMQQLYRTGEELACLLSIEKERADIAESSFVIKKETLELIRLDPEASKITIEDKAFIDSVKRVIKDKGDCINQSKLLEALGYAKGDRTQILKLEKYIGMFWKCADGKNRQKIFSLI
jgi:hypothetical protein